MSPIEVPLWASIPAALLLVLGSLLALVGALGLVRLPDFYTRMHPPAMGNTLGAASVLVASMLVGSALEHRPVVHEILISFFILLSAPVTAMLLIRAAVARVKKPESDKTR